LWARDQQPTPYRLQFSRRTDAEASGRIRIDGRWLPFVYDRRRRLLTIGTGEDERRVQLDEWGWEQ
ncbi:MAG: hypothetical protein D6775_12920, partial [Caldilineae bacterium]